MNEELGIRNAESGTGEMTSSPIHHSAFPIPHFPLETVWAVEETRFGAMINGLQSIGPEAARLRMRDIDLALDITIADGVAVIPIEGPLTKNASIFSVLFGGSSTLLIQQAVEQMLGDETVKAIVLKIDSPGGSVDGLAELADVIWEGRKRKKIVAQVTGLAASAGYYIASQAKEVYAQRMDLIGSIGTRMLVYDWNRFFENAGVTAIPIDTGKYKSAGAMGTEITEEQQDYFQSIVDAYFKDFVTMVARGRKVSQSAVKEWADGRVYPAAEAMVNGLIDGIQTLEVTVGGLKGAGKASKAKPAVTAAGADDLGAKDMSGTAQAGVETAVEAGETTAQETDRGATKNVAGPQPATLGELEAAVPGANSDFLIGCLKRAETVEQAKSAYIGELQTARQADAGRIEALQAAADKPGVKALGTGNVGDAASGGGDPVTEFNDLVNEKAKAGMPKPKAIAAIVKAHPELHQAMVAAYNDSHGRPGRGL